MLPDLNIRPEDDAAALPEKPESTFRWATVVGTAPLVIRLDGDSIPLSATPNTLEENVSEGDRVWVHLHGRSVIVLGRGTKGQRTIGDDDLTFPLYIAHRGAKAVYPEESMEGQRIMAQKGYPTEVDVRMLSDGRLVACHDDNTSRTMTGILAPVSNATSQQWRAARIKPVVTGGMSGTPIFFEDWLREMSSLNAVPVFEVKDSAALGPTIQAVRSAGLQERVIAQSFVFDDAAEMARQGIRTAYLFGGWWPDHSAADIAGAGLWGVGCSKNASPDDLERIHGYGLRVLVYTINDRSTAEDWLGRPYVDGIFSDDPEYVSDQVTELPGDTFGTGFLSPGTRMELYNDNGFYTDYHLNGAALTIPLQRTLANGRPYVVIPGLSTGAHSSFQITVDIEFGAESLDDDQSVSPGIILWKNTQNLDAPWRDSAYAGQEGFTVAARRNGQLQAWKYVNGNSATSIGGSNVQTGSDQFAPSGRSGYCRMVFTVGDGRVDIDSPSHGYLSHNNESFSPTGLTFALRGDRKQTTTFSNIRIVRF